MFITPVQCDDAGRSSARTNRFLLLQGHFFRRADVGLDRRRGWSSCWLLRYLIASSAPVGRPRGRSYRGLVALLLVAHSC